MQETQVTIDGETKQLPSPFLVLATQNPIEMEGVFALPEAQRDRFQQKLVVDMPDRDDERELLDRFDDAPHLDADSIRPVTTPSEILACTETVSGVHVAPAIKEYVIDVIDATREHSAVEHGASPRASLDFLDAAKAHAAIRNRGYVIPDDLKTLADSVLAHRLVLETDAGLRGTDPAAIVAETVEGVEPPTAGFGPDEGAAESAADGFSFESGAAERSVGHPRTDDA
jgi:MoxR-like ATPase